MHRTNSFAKLDDKELVEGLTATPINKELHEYFFYIKCKKFLNYISATLYNQCDSKHLVGELYEFLSNDNWSVLRQWKNKNGASLYIYIARCAINHFTKKEIAEKKRLDIEFMPDSTILIEQLGDFTQEEEHEMPPVWEAFHMLNERDQIILRLLVIDEKSMIEAAPHVWKYINSKNDISNISQKKIQSTIAIAKHRALLALIQNLKKITQS